MKTIEGAFAQLQRLGCLLDAADSGRTKLSPRNYWLAAKQVTALITEHLGNPEMRQLCQESDALSEMLSGTLLVLELEIGRTPFLLDLTPYLEPRV